MNRGKFANYTEKIRNMLPFWFKMKKQPKDSLGLQFLNVFGMQLDEIKFILEYAYEQVNLNLIDEKFIDIVYKAILPINFNMDNLDYIIGGKAILVQKNTLYDFFDLKNSYEKTNPIMTPDYYYIDYSKKIIYFRFPYESNDSNKSGYVTIVDKNNNKTIVNLKLHHVWNFFDEFGALVGCERLNGENNISYKKRILDVFKNPANSTKFGLMNGIARELNLRKHLIWHDCNNDFIIKDKMVIVNSIKVNDVFFDIDNIEIDTDNNLILKTTKEMLNTHDAEVSYVSGLELSSLSKMSTKLSTELFNADGTLKPLYLEYVKKIKKESPLLWNDFKYGDGVWVLDDEEFGTDHFSFIPNTYDMDIKGFVNFGFSER